MRGVDQPPVSLGEIDVLGLLAGQYGDQAADGHHGEVEADRVHAPVGGQPGGDGRHERGADDRGEVVADAGAGIAHIGLEQLGQERADRAERDAHQHEADAQERHRGHEVALAHQTAVQQEREGEGEHHQRAGREDDHTATADPVGVHAGQHDEQREHAYGGHEHQQILLVAEAEVAAAVGGALGAPRERPGGQRVEQR